MVTPSDQALFDQIKKKWGLSSQIAMLAEESAELSVAACHLNRANRDYEESLKQLAEEIADVELMIAEFRYYFPQLCDLIEDEAIKKRQKLRNILALAPRSAGVRP